MILLTIPLINYPAPKDKKKQKKKPIKKVPNSNPSTLIETSQQRVAFSNNHIQFERAIYRMPDRLNFPQPDRYQARTDLRISGGRISNQIQRISDLTTIDELDSNHNQNNNSAGERTQNLAMHTIVEEDIRRLRGNGNDLLEPIPGWQNPAVIRETTQSTQPQEDVHVIPIENDTDTVRTSNIANSTKCCNLRKKQFCFMIGIYVLTVVLLIVIGIRAYKRNEVEVSISTNDSSSINDLLDDYDSHYDIAPEKVRLLYII